MQLVHVVQFTYHCTRNLDNLSLLPHNKMASYPDVSTVFVVHSNQYLEIIVVNNF